MTPTVLTALSAAALTLALVAAVGLAVQSRRLHRLRDEAGIRDREVARMRADLDTVRRGDRPADGVDVDRPVVPRPRGAPSPTAWRRARAGGAGRAARRSVTR